MPADRTPLQQASLEAVEILEVALLALRRHREQPALDANPSYLNGGISTIDRARRLLIDAIAVEDGSAPIGTRENEVSHA